MIEVPHQDDMTVRNFYRHMEARHPMQGINFETLLGVGAVGDNGAYRAFLSYHNRIHDEDVAYETDESLFDHYHAEVEE